MSSSHLPTVLVLLCTALLSACASTIVQNSAQGLPQTSVARLVVAENRWAKPDAAIIKVNDSTGMQLVTLAPARGGAGTSITLLPGRYEVTMSCSTRGIIQAEGTPTAKVTLEAGIEYRFDCRLDNLIAYPVITSKRP